MPGHFWGLPFAIAGLSSLLPIAPVTSLVVISAFSTAGVCVIVHRLYGGRLAAAMFAAINFEWVLRSFEGSSEPLFMFLLFAGFLSARSDRWTLATLLLSLATTVRPVGFLALVCLAWPLLRGRRYGQVAVCTGVGIVVGSLYLVSVWAITGHPFANFEAYRSDWPDGWAVSWPLAALVPGIREGLAGERWMHYLLSLAWLGLSVAGVVRLWRLRNQPEPVARAEMLFATAFVAFFLCYNAPVYSAQHFPRFLMPVFPLLLVAFREWIPGDRRVLWTSALLTAILAAGAVSPLRTIVSRLTGAY